MSLGAVGIRQEFEDGDCFSKPLDYWNRSDARGFVVNYRRDHLG
jgi:hypothetical protein